ncbi:MAG TPA: diacylglycerol kinase family protein [Thermoanaerobaculia bacterium]|nr:diacylglycerol kinase family protein [Thermoanaerobaculia bacterium]
MLLFNPTAGKGRGLKKIELVQGYLRKLGADVEFQTPGSRVAFAAAAARASDGSYDRVIIAGGDGTLHVALNAIDLTRTALAIIPMGSGDDFAGAMNIPRDIEKACRIALESPLRKIDVATANDRRFLGVAGVGFDSVVASHANTVKKLTGPILYLYSLFKVLPRFQPIPMSITSASGRRDEAVMFAVVGNSSRYGGGIHIAPTALLDDGILDLFVVGKSTKWDLLKTLPYAYSGKHVRSPFVSTERGTRFTFDSPEPLEVYADGELVAKTPVTIAVLPEKLRIAAP